MKTYSFTVQISLNGNERDAREFVNNALSRYDGQFPPDDMFFPDNVKVKVARAKAVEDNNNNRRRGGR